MDTGDLLSGGDCEFKISKMPATSSSSRLFVAVGFRIADTGDDVVDDVLDGLLAGVAAADVELRGATAVSTLVGRLFCASSISTST